MESNHSKKIKCQEWTIMFDGLIKHSEKYINQSNTFKESKIKNDTML